MFKRRHRVSVIPLHGAIHSNGLSFHRVKPLIDQAYARKPDLIVLEINSPGGSPVESQMISQYLVYKTNTHGIPMAAYVTDIAASGGYWLAMTASPLIFVTPMSIVGSIGVVGAGFGYDRLMEKLGVDRRVHTVGVNKFVNDSFQPETPEGREKIKKIQTSIYDVFVQSVKEHRGDLLNLVDEEGEPLEPEACSCGEVHDANTPEDHEHAALPMREDELFSGDVWTGREAIDVGLVDGMYTVMEPHLAHIFFNDVVPKITYSNYKQKWLSKVLNPVGVLMDRLESTISTRMLNSRFGI